MTTARIRRVLRIGGSLAIVLPSSWVKGRIKAGEEMVIVENSELRIFPVHEKGAEVEREAEGVSNQ